MLCLKPALTPRPLNSIAAPAPSLAFRQQNSQTLESQPKKKPTEVGFLGKANVYPNLTATRSPSWLFVLPVPPLDTE